MDVKKCSELLPTAGRNALHRFLMVAAVAKMYISIIDELFPALPDDEQIVKGISDINADLPASSTIHFTTIPFPSMGLTNSCHHRAISVSNMPPCLWDTMAPRRCHILNFGIGWKGYGGGYHLSSFPRSGVRRFCLQMVVILSTFWHPCRLGSSQYQVDFYTVLKIGPC